MGATFSITREVLKIGQLMGMFTQKGCYYKSALALVFQITAGYKITVYRL